MNQTKRWFDSYDFFNLCMNGRNYVTNGLEIGR